MMTQNNVLNPAQIEHLSALRYINNIDEHMKIVSSVKVLDDADQYDNAVLLVLDIFIDDKQIDKMSFSLRNYAYEEIVELAQHIRDNDYILRAVDTALSGDIE
ncbi:hypothetical protein [Methylomonas albis]|jgi:hypothetical protein|uniref:Uncharacterized protein n=2 Tax=Methylomonas albis TaxID=1854563 RepID=A0ABR9CYY6_9GAMM|nr:hypothetical protein [Methylomonas albis]MBD9356090.1 hypothetical protein [Methylomonas albis]